MINNKTGNKVLGEELSADDATIYVLETQVRSQIIIFSVFLREKGFDEQVKVKSNYTGYDKVLVVLKNKL